MIYLVFLILFTITSGGWSIAFLILGLILSLCFTAYEVCQMIVAGS